MQNKIIGVVAPKGSGKTTVVAAKLVAVCPRVAIYDPMAATDTQYRSVASHIVERDLTQAHKIMAEDDFQLLFEPKLPTQDGEEWYYEDFRPFIYKVWRRVQLIGPMTLIVDEAHYTMSARTMPLEMWNIITNGRRYGLDVVWVTQRFVGVNPWVRTNADEYWMFRIAGAGDLDEIRSVMGREIMEQVRNLRRLDVNTGTPGQLLIWNSLDGSVTVEDANGQEQPTKQPIDKNDSERSPGTPGESEEEGQDHVETVSDA